MSRFRQLTFSDSYIWNLAWERNLLELSATYSDPVRSSSFQAQSTHGKTQKFNKPQNVSKCFKWKQESKVNVPLKNPPQPLTNPNHMHSKGSALSTWDKSRVCTVVPTRCPSKEKSTKILCFPHFALASALKSRCLSASHRKYNLFMNLVPGFLHWINRRVFGV